MKRYEPESVRAQILVLLHKWGMTENDAAITAEVMLDTDLSGIDSHGISMLPMYDAMMLSGEINPRPTTRTVREGPGFALLDADNGLGHPVAVKAMKLAMEKARTSGIGCVSVYNSHHYGAAGYYVRIAAEKGLFGMTTSTTSLPAVIPTGAQAAVLGTNPIAFAAPSANTAPFVLDMSTSIVAGNKVKTYALRDQPLPTGWVSDRNGNSVTDSKKAHALIGKSGSGGLLPLGGASTTTGGHKGFGLSIMVQILSASLNGAAQPGHGNGHHNIGHFFLAIDPEAFNPEGGAEEITGQLLQDLKHAPPLPGQKVVIPGEPEAASRLIRAETGIPLPPALIQKIAHISRTNGVDSPLAEMPSPDQSAGLTPRRPLGQQGCRR